MRHQFTNEEIYEHLRECGDGIAGYVSRPRIWFTSQQRQALSEALEFLEPTEAKTLYLHYWMELSETEVAERMKLKVQDVERLINSGRESLRRLCVSHPAFSHDERQALCA